MFRLILLISLALLNTHAGGSEAKATKPKTATDVIVAIIPGDIPLAKANENLWACLPQEARESRFPELDNYSNEQCFSEFAEQLVSKAKALNLESEPLRAIMEHIRTVEKNAVVPIAAFRGKIDGRDVWIIHLQWEWNYRLALKPSKDGPVLDKRQVQKLSHIRTYAVGWAPVQVIKMQSCM